MGGSRRAIAQRKRKSKIRRDNRKSKYSVKQSALCCETEVAGEGSLFSMSFSFLEGGGESFSNNVEYVSGSIGDGMVPANGSCIPVEMIDEYKVPPGFVAISSARVVFELGRPLLEPLVSLSSDKPLNRGIEIVNRVYSMIHCMADRERIFAEVVASLVQSEISRNAEAAAAAVVALEERYQTIFPEEVQLKGGDRMWCRVKSCEARGPLHRPDLLLDVQTRTVRDLASGEGRFSLDISADLAPILTPTLMKIGSKLKHLLIDLDRLQFSESRRFTLALAEHGDQDFEPEFFHANYDIRAITTLKNRAIICAAEAMTYYLVLPLYRERRMEEVRKLSEVIARIIPASFHLCYSGPNQTGTGFLSLAPEIERWFLNHVLMVEVFDTPQGYLWWASVWRNMIGLLHEIGYFSSNQQRFAATERSVADFESRIFREFGQIPT